VAMKRIPSTFYPLFRLRIAALFAAVCCTVSLKAQEVVQPLPEPSVSIQQLSQRTNAGSASEFLPISTTQEKWNYFVRETASPLTFAGGVFNAAVSQVTNTDPRYGVNRVAFAERFGASVGDITTQNFFGDFVVASVFHEDPRYIREGSEYGFWHRAGYALSRAVVIRKDSGGNTFNYDNVMGSAFSTGFSNLYYPRASRNTRGMVMHFGSDVADNGFVNLAPEFWPDFRDWLLRRHRSN
jgi:hypothetical protein